VLFRRYTIAKTSFDNHVPTIRISEEKGFASCLNNKFRLMKQGPFLLGLCRKGAFTDFLRFFLFAVFLSR
ncbi:hypothetical protein K0H26_22945, partial [Bacteroides fragilis]|nr:hypothetical protein [Bacteroides fragilis]